MLPCSYRVDNERIAYHKAGSIFPIRRHIYKPKPRLKRCGLGVFVWERTRGCEGVLSGAYTPQKYTNRGVARPQDGLRTVFVSIPYSR